MWCRILALLLLLRAVSCAKVSSFRGLDAQVGAPREHPLREWKTGAEQNATDVAAPRQKDATKDSSTAWRNETLSVPPKQPDIQKDSAADLEKEIFEEPRKVMGVALNGTRDVQTLNTSLFVGGLGAAGVLLAFAFLRVAVPQVYERRRSEPEEADQYHLEVSSGLRCLDFIWRVWNSTPEDEVRLAGLDGWSLLEFVRLNLRIMSILGPFLLSVLVPLHFVASTESHNTLDWLSRLDIGNLPREDWMLWFHAAVVWFVVLISTWQITLAHDGFTERRYQWLSTVPRPRSTTVMVRNIPPMYRSDSALKEYFDTVFSEESMHTVERAYVIRKTGRLPKLVQQMQSSQYEAAVTSNRLNKARLRGLPTSELEMELKRSKSAVDTLRSRVAKEQAQIEAALQGPRPDSKVASSSGFVTFTTILSQRLASREQCTRDVQAFRMYMAPDPHDVLYENLAEDDINASSWKWIGKLALVAVFLFWVPIVVAISGWTTLSSIQGTVPVIKKFVHAHPAVGNLLSGVLATAALKMFMAFLPTVLHFIITTTLHLKAGSIEQLKLQQWSTAFLLLFVVLVTSLGRGLTITFVIVMQEPAKIVSLLAASLPSASHFYFNYVILGWFVLPLDMLRMANLAKWFFFRKVCAFEEEEARQYSEQEDAAYYGLGTRMARSVLMASIFYTFSSCSPLILVFTWIYFFLAQFVYGYMLLFCESKKPDTGGVFWVQAMEQMFLILAIYVMLMVGVLRALAREGIWAGPPAAACASLLVIYMARREVNNLAFDTLPLEEVVKAFQDNKDSAQLGSTYMQPECDPALVAED
ncbi:unnamed protein product [Effrenium voratum]|uniref:Uncharacterized protein n=1 Tax=Effrenium voratum TaxID=2562239 RepID=A0AA36JHA2_9DINO|nr:unnamed protein product [Effrenium voratum]CAJ1405031.1 unnamed protein product [Effrenium voratum]CAJ1448369.1 unnamed protein product [Effrenium voratum]CAJ1451898.1 unnamed protein product [Effrenium voratum]